MASQRARRSAFVPRLLVRTAIAGVVPACATACGGNGSSSSSGAFFGVALDAFGGVGIAAFGDSAVAENGDTGSPVATLCGDPKCPPLPGVDASMEDVEAGPPFMDGGSEASADAGMADGAGQEQDASTDGPRSDSGGDGGSPESAAD